MVRTAIAQLLTKRMYGLAPICTTWVAAASMGLAFVPGHAARADVLVSSRLTNQVLRYDDATGAFLGVFADSSMSQPNGMAVGADGHVYVANGNQSVVNRYDGETGALIDAFVENDPATPTDETGGLLLPRNIRFGPDGNLYVASGGTDAVMAYNGVTGAFLRVAAVGGGLDGPIDFDFGADGHLYVAGGISQAIHRFNGTTGAFIDVFVDSSMLGQPTGMTFGPNGQLFVADAIDNDVKRFSAINGFPIGTFTNGGSLNTPIGIAFGPNGDLFTASFGADNVPRFDGALGSFLLNFVSTASGGLDGPSFIIFRSPATECLGDCAPLPVADGEIDIRDFLTVLAAWGASSHPCDVDGSNGVGIGDFLLVLANWGPCN